MLSLLHPLLAQATQAAQTTTSAVQWYDQGWFKALVVVAMLVVPYMVGEAIARSIRMADYGWKLGIILVALVGGITLNSLYRPRLGIDLKGGVKLIYEVDQSKLQSANVSALTTQVNKAIADAQVYGDEKATIATGDNNTLEIRLPSDDATKAAKAKAAIDNVDLKRLTGAGLTGGETRRDKNGLALVYQVLAASRTVDMDDLVRAVSKRVNPGGQREVAIRKLGGLQIEVAVPDVDQAEIEAIKRKIATAGALEFRIVADGRLSEHGEAIEAAKKKINSPQDDVIVDGRIAARWVALGKDDNGKVIRPPAECQSLYRKTKSAEQVLMIIDDFNVTGQYLTYSGSSYSAEGLAVAFELDSAGAKRFGEFTRTNLADPVQKVKHELAVVLDNTVLSVASINSQINDRGQISGNFTQQEVDFIVGVLRAGQLPAALQKEPVSQEAISAELGQDTIRSSSLSMIVSTAMVLLFMLVYYRFAGIVANFAVLFNLLLVVALMILFHAAFTLAGLAGLVLSVGMAVDSNVLIYERMREEKQRGAALRMVIRNGFGRAMTTIIDTHFTTIITGVILYWVGSEQLRGFAATLVMGLVVNLFTAVFCARVVFDIAERKRVLKELKMMHLFGETHINFVAYVKPALVVSAIISILGIWSIAKRGTDILDIDFTGGYSVQIVLDKPMDVTEVRKKLETPDVATKLPDATVNMVTSGTIKENTQFIIRTSNSDAEAVKEEISSVFGTALRHYKVGEFSKPRPITGPKNRFGDDDAAAKPDKNGKTPAIKGPGFETESTKPETKDTDTKPDEPKVTEPNPTDSKAKEPKSGEPNATEPKPTDPRPTDSKPTDSKTPEKTAAPDKDAKPVPPPAPGEPDLKLKPSSDLHQLRRMVLALAAPQTFLADETAAPKATDAKSTDDAAKAADPKAAPEEKKPADDKKSADDKKPADEKPAPAADDKSGDTKPADDKTPPPPGPKTTEPPTKTTDDPIKRSDDPAKPSDAPAKTADAPAVPEVPVKTSDEPKTDAEMPSEGVSTASDPFIGGSEVTLNFDKVEPIKYDSLHELIERAIGEEKTKFELSNPDYTPGSTHPYSEWTLRLAKSPTEAVALLSSIKNQLASRPVFLGDSKIGGRVARDTQYTAIYALLASIAMIVVYIWIRFQNVIFGIGAVVALVHDVLVTLAGIGLSSILAPYLGFALVDPFKISLNVVAAMLTIVGYSISDTIVIFDRIREVRGKSPELTEDMINKSVNQTLSRTVLTVFTVLLVTIILYIFGGQAIHAFAFTMLIGLISGTYSSVYIAAPVLLWLKAPAGDNNPRR